MHFTYTVEIDIERSTGKFASREEIATILYDDISSAIDNVDLSSLGAEGTSEYEVMSYEVEEVEQEKPKKPRRKERTLEVPQQGGDNHAQG